MEERFETQVPARSTPPMRTDGQASRALCERRFEISSGPAIVLTPVLPKLFLATSGAWAQRGSTEGCDSAKVVPGVAIHRVVTCP